MPIGDVDAKWCHQFTDGTVEIRIWIRHGIQALATESAGGLQDDENRTLVLLCELPRLLDRIVPVLHRSPHPRHCMSSRLQSKPCILELDRKHTDPHCGSIDLDISELTVVWRFPHDLHRQGLILQMLAMLVDSLGKIALGCNG